MLQMLLKIGEFSPGTFSPCMMSGFPAYFYSATSVEFIDPSRSGRTKVRKITRAMGRCVRGLSIGNAPRLIRLLWGKGRRGKNNLFLAVRADLPVARSAPGITIQNDSADFQRGLIFQGPQCRGFLITDGAVKCAVDGRKQPVHAVASFSSIQCPGSGDHKAPYNNDREYAVDELPEAVRCPS